MKKLFVGIITLISGLAIGAIGMNYIKNKTVEEKGKKVDKFKSYYNMLNQWLILKQEGKALSEYFIEKGYRTIAIYGMGEMGNRLYDELKSSDIKVKYAVDKNVSEIYSELKIIDLEEDFEEVDAIVVSAVFAFDEIEELLAEKVDCPILSLEDLVYQL